MSAQRLTRMTAAALLSLLAFFASACSSSPQPAGNAHEASAPADLATAEAAASPTETETSSPEASPTPSHTPDLSSLDIKGDVPNPCKLLSADEFELATGSALKDTESNTKKQDNGYRECRFQPYGHDKTAYLTVMAVREGPMDASSSESGATMNWSDSFRNVEGYSGNTSANDKLCMESNDLSETMDGIGCLTIVLNPDKDLRTDAATTTGHIAHAWLRYNQRPGEEFTAIGFVTDETAYQPSLVIAVLLPPGKHSKDRLLDIAGSMANTLQGQLHK